MTQDGTATENDVRRPRIRVVGCGGAGTNAVHRLMSWGLEGPRTVVVNTDAAHLNRAECHHRVLVGDGAIHSTGGRPEVGLRLVARHEKDVRPAVTGGDLTFIVAGFGGGLGTGAAPLLASWARASGAVVVGLATTPFRAERSRHAAARKGLDAMRAACNSLVVLENDRLASRLPDLPVEQAFAVMDHLMGELIRGLADALHAPALIQIDFPDLREVLREGGTSTLLFGEGDVRDPEGVVEKAWGNAFLDADASDAKGAVIHVTSGPSLSLGAVDRVVGGFTRGIRPGARVAFGVRTAPEFEGSMRVMTVLTGVGDRAGSSPAGLALDVASVR